MENRKETLEKRRAVQTAHWKNLMEQRKKAAEKKPELSEKQKADRERFEAFMERMRAAAKEAKTKKEAEND